MHLALLQACGLVSAEVACSTGNRLTNTGSLYRKIVPIIIPVFSMIIPWVEGSVTVPGALYFFINGGTHANDELITTH